MYNRLIKAFMLIALSLSFSLEAFSQTDTTLVDFIIQDVQFKSVFGVKDKKSDGVFCLMGNGFFRAQRSKDMDKLIREWIQQHPNATILPIVETKSKSGQGIVEKFTYCWIVDKSENLNIYLVEKGAISGSTMIKPRLQKEYQTEDNYKVLVPDEEYNHFLKKIKEAENRAFKAKIGIWESFKEEL